MISYRLCTENDLPIIDQYMKGLYNEMEPSFDLVQPNQLYKTFQELSTKPEKGCIIVIEIIVPPPNSNDIEINTTTATTTIVDNNNNNNDLYSLIEDTTTTKKIIVGYAIVIYAWSNEYGGNVIEIDELYVATPYRKQGIASNFIQWIISSISSSSTSKESVSSSSLSSLSFRSLTNNNDMTIVACIIETSDDNIRAKNVYRSNGFIETPNIHYITFGAEKLARK